MEFLDFLKKIDRENLPPISICILIVDNYAIHKTPAVQRWLARHKRRLILSLCSMIVWPRPK